MIDMTALTRLPISYRQEIVRPVMQAILAGESCAVVGVAGTGKSNLLRQLARADVRRAYLGEQYAQCLFAFVDFNRRIELSDCGFWELLLHRMVASFSEAGGEPGLPAQLADLHERATMSRDAVVAQRNFETAVGMLCSSGQQRLVLLFDQFEGFWKSLGDTPFLVLRSLRDEFKYQLCFVVATRDELSRLREDPAGCQDFHELFLLHTHALGPHSEADAENQVDRFVVRGDPALPEDLVSRLVVLTGRHPALLKAAYLAVAAGRVDPTGDLVLQLVEESSVKIGCDEIWNDLGDDERKTLSALAADQLPSNHDQEAVRLLRFKGLLNQEAFKPFCELFSRYIETLRLSISRSLSFDPQSGQVTVDGSRLAAELTKLELAALRCLYKKRGQVCTREELTGTLYPGEEGRPNWQDEVYDTYYDRRLDTVIRRLRDKIEPDRDNPRYILTVRERGYKLALDGVEGDIC